MRSSLLIKYALLVIWATVLACVVCYLFVDIPLALYFRSGFPLLEGAAIGVYYFFDPTLQLLLWPLLFLLVQRISRLRFLSKFFFLLMLSAPLTVVIFKAIKYLGGRARPELLFSSDLYGFFFFKGGNPYHSFPSGHACMIGALFGTLSWFFPKKTVLFLSFAIVITFARVIIEDHYLSDVLAGVILGGLISQWVCTSSVAHRLKE